MSQIKEQKISRKNYSVQLRRKRELNESFKYVPTGGFYLHIITSKGKLSLSPSTVEPLAQALKDLANGKVKCLNKKPSVINKSFVMNVWKRFEFNLEGESVRTGPMYITVMNPAGKKFLLDGNDVKQMGEDLASLELPISNEEIKVFEESQEEELTTPVENPEESEKSTKKSKKSKK